MEELQIKEKMKRLKQSCDGYIGQEKAQTCERVRRTGWVNLEPLVESKCHVNK